MKKITLLTLLSAALVGTPALANDKLTLNIDLMSIRNSEGRINLALFNNKSAFDKADLNKAVALISQQATKGKMRFQFDNLPKGDYAVMIHHDENNNGVLEDNGGYPTEGYAYFYGEGRNSIPSFRKAKLPLSSSTKTQPIQMIYLR